MAEHFYYSIASGSSGNCGLYVSDGTAVLIDVGVSLRKLTAALAAFDMKPGELDALIITHEHIDHVKGLAMFLKKTEVPVFASRGTAAALTAKEPAFEGRLTAFESGDAFCVGETTVRSFATPHDAADSVGYILENGRHRFGFATTSALCRSLRRRCCAAARPSCSRAITIRICSRPGRTPMRSSSASPGRTAICPTRTVRFSRRSSRTTARESWFLHI